VTGNLVAREALLGVLLLPIHIISFRNLRESLPLTPVALFPLAWHWGPDHIQLIYIETVNGDHCSLLCLIVQWGNVKLHSGIALITTSSINEYISLFW